VNCYLGQGVGLVLGAYNSPSRQYAWIHAFVTKAAHPSTSLANPSKAE